MDKKFNTIMRSGKAIDIFSEIEELQEQYLADLQASVDVFDDYDEVSNETLNDYVTLCKVLSIFCKLGYLFTDEYIEMKRAADEQRKAVLEGLEGKKE